MLFLLLMLPGHSALLRLTPRLDISITTAWWWSLFVARYFVWLLVGLNAVLLLGLWESAQFLLPLSEPSPKYGSIRTDNWDKAHSGEA